MAERAGGGVALLLAVVAVFGQAIAFQFVPFDDGIHVYENPLLHPPTLAHVAHAWAGPYLGLYIPLTYTVWSGLAVMTGSPFSPWAFHLANVVLHALNAWLVFLILLRLVNRTSCAWPAFAGALLFAWHPVQVEPVAWITGLKDVLAGTFSFAALLLAVRARQEDRKWDERLALLAFGLGLLAKPSAAAVPLLLLAIDVGLLGRPVKRALVSLVPWLGLTLPLTIITKLAQPDAHVPFVTPWLARPLILADTLAFYLGKLVFPWVCVLDYGRTPEKVLANPMTPLLLLVPVLLVVFFWRRLEERRVRRQAWTVLALFVAGFLPVAGLVPFSHQAFSTVADRFLYLALLGPSLGVALFLAGGGRRRAVIVVLALGWYGAKTFVQTGYWRNAPTLIAHLARWNPSDPMLFYSLGVVEAEASEPGGHLSPTARLLGLPPPPSSPAERERNAALAIAHYRQAIRLDPHFPGAENNLGLLYARRGAWGEASAHFRRALELDPGLAEAGNNLGVALAANGELDEAILTLRRLVDRLPRLEGARVNLGLALAGKHAWDEARVEFQTALELHPGNAIARAELAKLVERARRERLITKAKEER